MKQGDIVKYKTIADEWRFCKLVEKEGKNSWIIRHLNPDYIAGIPYPEKSLYHISAVEMAQLRISKFI